jgi:oligoendopeptidase F
LANGEKIDVNKANMTYYLSILEDPSDRTKVFNAIYKFYNDHKATLAGIYQGIVKSEYANMKARGYKSMVEAKLDYENIPVSVYESLMKTTRENTAPLKRYYQIRKKYFKLDKIRTYDRFLQFRKSNMEYSYPKVKEMVLDAMNFMGSEYKSVAELCLSSGRVDVDIKDGKRNGAYSNSTYHEGAFILLNHNGDLSSAFTVAHECGHSIHSTYTNRSQEYINSEYSIFVAEVASTFNEHMFLDYLMNKVEDKNEKIVLLQQAIDNICATYYRQTLFASFEYEAHKLIEEGHPIDDRALSDIMKSLYKDYYDIDLDEEEYKSLVWAYIPHFFNSPFYVYQYATSFSASMKLYDDIKNKKEGAFDRYINLLKSGASNYPVLLLKEAGCDLTKEDAFMAVVKRLDSLLDMLEDLLK